MRHFVAVALALAPLTASANDIEIQRSVIQRDQQSAEFAARARENIAASGCTRQLSEVIGRRSIRIQVARQLQPYQRQKMADERTLVLPPPTATLRKPPEKPLPLPGPRPGIELVPPQSPPN